jgi:hypothetical protein
MLQIPKIRITAPNKSLFLMKPFYRLTPKETTALDQLTPERSFSLLEFLAAVMFWAMTENVRSGRGFRPTSLEKLDRVSLDDLTGSGFRLSMTWLGQRSTQSAPVMRQHRALLVSLGCFESAPQPARRGKSQPIAPITNLDPCKVFAYAHHLVKKLLLTVQQAPKGFKLFCEAFKKFFAFSIFDEIPPVETLKKAAQSVVHTVVGVIATVAEYVESLQQELAQNPPSPPPKGLISSALRSHLLK